MDKAIRQNIDRRALLKGASIATVAAAIPATIAAAIGAPSAPLAEAADPIFAILAERDRIMPLVEAAVAHYKRIEAAWPALRELLGRSLTGAAAAERDLLAERSGWNRVTNEQEALCAKVCDLENVAMAAPIQTAAGARARLAIICHVSGFDPDDMYGEALTDLVDDLIRMARKGGAS
jgi:hypothetical protein